MRSKPPAVQQVTFVYKIHKDYSWNAEHSLKSCKIGQPFAAWLNKQPSYVGPERRQRTGIPKSRDAPKPWKPPKRQVSRQGGESKNNPDTRRNTPYRAKHSLSGGGTSHIHPHGTGGSPWHSQLPAACPGQQRDLQPAGWEASGRGRELGAGSGAEPPARLLPAAASSAQPGRAATKRCWETRPARGSARPQPAAPGQPPGGCTKPPAPARRPAAPPVAGVDPAGGAAAVVDVVHLPVVVPRLLPARGQRQLLPRHRPQRGPRRPMHAALRGRRCCRCRRCGAVRSGAGPRPAQPRREAPRALARRPRGRGGPGRGEAEGGAPGPAPRPAASCTAPEAGGGRPQRPLPAGQRRGRPRGAASVPAGGARRGWGWVGAKGGRAGGCGGCGISALPRPKPQPRGGHAEPRAARAAIF